jgi:hypothetical protein
MAVRMTLLFFWVVMPCRLTGRYQHFRKNMQSLSSGLKMIKYVPTEHWYVPSDVHGVITQENKSLTNIMLVNIHIQCNFKHKVIWNR